MPDDRSDKFVVPAAALVWPQCVYCKHLSRVEVPGLTGQACAAFPGKVPDAIYQNKVDHRQPYLVDGEPADVGIAGDTSIVFEPEEGIDPDALKALYRLLDALPS